MEKLFEILAAYRQERIALYGLGTETEKAIAALDKEFDIFGLLDGFSDSGSLYGKQIVSLEDIVTAGVKLVVVVARPGSCKAIKKRIGAFCTEHGIALYDVRGKNLLVSDNVLYHFRQWEAPGKEQLRNKIQEADVVSFDLFDTLITRCLYSYTDIFELVRLRLEEEGFHPQNLENVRLEAEKELSRTGAPTLLQIYERAVQLLDGQADFTSQKAAQTEWEIEQEIILPRHGMVEIFDSIVSLGKPVYIITDTYYSRGQIEELLRISGIGGYTGLLVSSEEKTGKMQKLFERYKGKVKAENYLHIGDDASADIASAQEHGIETFRICSGMELFEALGALGTEGVTDTLADRLKIGMLVACMMNDPFCFDTQNRALELGSAYDIGYLLCAPMMTDFVLWMDSIAAQRGIKNIWLCARDGYLLRKMYELLETDKEIVYFLTSRTAAIRAGMETEEDILYVNSMKFSGTSQECLKVRFGLEPCGDGAPDRESGLMRYADLILEKALRQKEHYRKYIEKQGNPEGDIAVFDFVAKGTTQMYLQRLVDNHLKGLYFLQPEPEFMSDKGLDIEPFYGEEEKDESAIFNHYYILETILTAPHPSVLEFTPDGDPVYAEETRSKEDILCFLRAQEGILDYFKTYISVLPKKERMPNKKLDELLLALITRVKIKAADFLSLTVEDPFFNRMTDIREVIE